jgi:ABC-type transporter Mla subunit MlaD
MATKQAGTTSGESYIRRHRNFVVGLFAVVPVVVLLLLCLFTLAKVAMEWWQPWDHLYVVYDRSYGLSSTNNVTISDYDIGHVARVELTGQNRTVVTLKIKHGYMPLIKKDVRAQLAQKNLVGEWVISLRGGSEGAGGAVDGDTLISEYSLRLDVLAEQVAGMITNVDSIIRIVVTGKGTIGKALKEDSLVVQVEGILRNVNTLTQQSAAMMRKADGLINDLATIGSSGVTLSSAGIVLLDSVQTLLSTVQQSLKDVPAIIKNVNDASGEIAPLMNQVQGELDNADAMMRGLQKNWLFQKAVGKPEDRMLKDVP